MPSLVNGRTMNNYDFDRGPARHNGLGPDDDMRREEDDIYRRPNGGFTRFNTVDMDQNSLSDFRSNEPKFELDHLATFAAGSRNGVIHAEDGLRKLRQMENTTGIWTMRCVLIVERGYLVILDNSTGDELERFPLQMVQDPTAIFKNDRREIYNNLVLFTIGDDQKKRNPQADMHIFQSCKAPAQEIVDEVLAAKNGQQRMYPAGGGSSLMIYQNPNLKNYRSKIPPPPVGPVPEPPNSTYDFRGMREVFDSQQNNTIETRYMSNGDSRQQLTQQQGYISGGGGNAALSNGQFVGGAAALGNGQFGGPFGQQRNFITRVNTIREREDIEGGSNEILERDVQLLNHCFDDIEKFVARLQQAAESYKELEKRKRERGAKNKKRQSGGDGMLNARARPPPDRDFVDMFQKFKLSFNLLAKLKAHIHDPNAPELVHFLFTPLSLIYEASRDPYHGNQNLGDQAVAPVLTAEAKQLLLNCLTSKEIELWQALGKHWTTSRAEWNGHIPPYVPEFYDGWQPAASVIDEVTSRSVLNQPALVEPLPVQEPLSSRARAPAVTYNPRSRPMPYPDDDDRPHISYDNQYDYERSDEPPREYDPSPRDIGRAPYDPSPRGYDRYTRNLDPMPQSHGGYDGQVSRGFERHIQDVSPPRSGIQSPYSDFEPPARRPEPLRTQEPPVRTALSRQDQNADYLTELMKTNGIVYEAAHDRSGKNPKELTILKGDVLQVLDSSKNWWKLKNFKSETGFAPYTILKPLKTEDNLPSGAPISTRQTTTTASDNSYEDNISRQGAARRGEFKYF